MTSAWWADVGGQVFAGMILLAVAGTVTALTPWGKRVRSRIGSAFVKSYRLVTSLRVTTRPRIDAEIAEAVREATEEAEPDDDEPPLRPAEHTGWVMLPAPAPRTWLLRNQTGESATVLMLMLGHNSNFEWEPPDFPWTLHAGESLSFPARRIRRGASFLPFMDAPVANVLWEDSHGDQHEDIVWIVSDR